MLLTVRKVENDANILFRLDNVEQADNVRVLDGLIENVSAFSLIALYGTSPHL